MWSKERNHDLARAASLAPQPLTDLRERKIIAQVCPQLHERQPRGVLASAAIRAVIIGIIDVRERIRFEPGVLHAPTLAPVGCGLLVYNSYSIDRCSTLYKALGNGLCWRLQSHVGCSNREDSLMRALTALFFIALIAGCSASSHVLVGTQRPPIPPDQVRLYTHPPEKFEEVAILEATSKHSISPGDQRKIDKVIERLKEQAAALGANGILLEGLGEQYAGSVGTAYSIGISATWSAT
jgi:hypothetical protein